MTDLNRRTVLGALGAAATLPIVPGMALAQDGPLKVGFVYIGPVGDFGWTYAHEQGRLQLVEELGDAVETTIVENVAEGPDAERIIRQLAQDGNQLIFTTSFGYMNPTIKVAKQFPDVYFEHATGYQRAENVATYNARFYEGRAVIGTIAGMMSEAGTAGYIASFPIPEVVMGINAFQLAAQRVNPDFKTNVVWVSTWYDPAKEADAARALMDQGADMITQHTDSPAALQAAEERGVFAFGQASDMSRFAPTAHLTAIEDHWGPYYVKRAKAVLDGTWESTDTWAGMAEGEVVMSEYRDNVPEDVKAAAQAMEAGIIDGSFHPFTGPIYDQEGTLRVPEGETMTDEQLASMDWYVQGVVS
jgi:simple sugar transport system substrate-binding protein